jgi:hypothetical protein
MLAYALIITGTTTEDVDPEKMTNAKLYAHFTQLLVGCPHDVDTRLGDVDSKLSYAMEKIDGLEEAFNAKLDAKFEEVLARLLPQPGVHMPRARSVPLAPPPAGTATAAAAAMEVATEDGYAAPGRSRQYIRNAHPPPRPVHDDEHVAKLKLYILPFEGRYNPDAYLTWKLEVEQRFACLRYPEHLRVSSATCEFTDFASIWWSEHCRVSHANIHATWIGLKHAMHTHFVTPHYQRDLLKKIGSFRTRQKFCPRILSRVTNGHDSLWYCRG